MKILSILVSLLLVTSTVFAQEMREIMYDDFQLHNARATTHDGTAVSVDYSNTVSFDVSISGTSAEVIFRIAGAGKLGWQNLACTASDDTTAVTSTTASGVFTCNVAGGDTVSARVDECTSCTVSVVARRTTAVIGGGGGGGGGGGAWTQDVTTANSLGNARCIGDGVNKLCFYTDGTLGPLARPNPDANTRFYIWTNFTGCIPWDIEGNACMITYDPDAASKNAMYQFGANYKPVASIPVTLYPRGAASYSEASVVSNQPKGGYIQVTDADTDAVDFRFVVTGKVVGITTATVRLYGVSDHATPSGNIVLNCAMRSNRPGTDTYVAHSTTGEQAVTLTPATQNRPVSAVSSAITLNGTVAEFSEVEGSCEVNASSTTSAQLTDFFLRSEAIVQLLTNSWSD